jgi:DNA polymerase delta subunit 2
VASKLIDLQPASTRGGGADGAAAPPAAMPSLLAVGCVYKDQRLKPSILDEYAGDRMASEPPAPRANYSGADDGLVLEDESGRVGLAPGGLGGRHSAAAFRALVGQLVCGVVCGVRGRVLPTGELAVDDVVFPGLGLLPATVPSRSKVPHPLRDYLPPTPRGEPPLFALLLSGLSVGGDDSGGAQLQLLLEWVAGCVGVAGAPGGGGGSGDPAGAARIARIVIAGGTVGKVVLPLVGGGPKGHSGGAGASASSSSSSSSSAGASSSAWTAPAASSSSNPLYSSVASSALHDAEASVAPLREADVVLAALASCAPVDLMPGEGEPSNHTLPQQPLHPCLFPAATRYSSFRCVTVRRAKRQGCPTQRARLCTSAADVGADAVSPPTPRPHGGAS